MHLFSKNMYASMHLFSQIFDFQKITFQGVSLISNLTSILSYVASVPRYTTKMSTFTNIDFLLKFYYLSLKAINKLISTRFQRIFVFERLLQ